MADKVSQILYFSKMKAYILNCAGTYYSEKVNPKSVEELQHDYNWFLTNEGTKIYDENDPENVIVKLDKNFIDLCSIMEENNTANPRLYSVIQFYGKLDYLNSKSKKDGGQ